MKQQRMNLLLRILFIILIIAISGAAVLQIFAQNIWVAMRHMVSQHGWQREIWFFGI